jgi:hypothetical protein
MVLLMLRPGFCFPYRRKRAGGTITLAQGLAQKKIQLLLIGSMIFATTPPQWVQTPERESRPFSILPLIWPMELDFMQRTHHTWFRMRNR